jgi:hypothetical protein
MTHRKRMPGKRWKDGVSGWESDAACSTERLRKSLRELLDPNYTVSNPILYEGAVIEVRFNLALFEWWQGNESVARKLFAEAATATAKHLDRWLPTRTESQYTNYAQSTQLGAMAASLSGQPQLAHQLFAQAELLATGLLSSDASPPASYLEALDCANVQRPYIRAYCLLRLGRLSGFHSFLYSVPLAQARKATPLWQSTDIPHLLDTANLCFELWRSQRCGLDSLKKKKFEPLLRALAACLAPNAGEPERLAARMALQSYQEGITDLHFFLEMYPRVLDLRAAYPHIFS